jgi:hypothetical protein
MIGANVIWQAVKQARKGKSQWGGQLGKKEVDRG